MGIQQPEENDEVFEPQQVFTLLGNETRMEILQRLWEAYDPLAETNGLSFSDLYDRVDVEDSGQFNYHLDKLRGVYVGQSGDRYELRPVGRRLVQSVLAGAGQEFAYEPTEIDASCRLCDSPIALTYDGSRVYLVCTACDGNFDDERYPDGTLWGQTVPPAGLIDRSPEELFAALTFLDWPRKAMLTGNVCSRCTGVLDQSLDICEEHDPTEDGPCESCGYIDPIRVHWVCEVCKFHATGTPAGFVKNHPAVIAFRYDHGIDFGYPYGTNEFDVTQEHEPVQREIDYEQDLLSTDPPRLSVRVSYRDDAVELVLDADLDVRSARREPDTGA
jgi:DNA-binding transcriptional ArsR family regulator